MLFRSNPWAAEQEQVGDALEPDEDEESGEDEASRGANPSGEDEASRGADPSGGDAGSRNAPPGVDLQEISSSGDEDAFRVVRSQRPTEEEGSNRRGRHEPRTKALHDTGIGAASRDAPPEEATAPPETAGASTLQPPKGKKRVWRAADE